MKAQRGAGFGIVSYVVMAVIIVLILIGGLLLVNVVTSSSPSPSAGAGEAGASASAIAECQDSEWFDASAQACVPRAVCEAGQQYDEGSNTCSAPLPTVTAIAPTSGLSTGGTEVRVTGTGFEDGASLLIGGVEATDATVVNDTTITATTPGSDALYPVDVEVVNPGSEPVHPRQRVRLRRPARRAHHRPQPGPGLHGRWRAGHHQGGRLRRGHGGVLLRPSGDGCPGAG